MKTAVIYARYSSNSQTEQSIEGQLRICTEFAQKNDILISSVRPILRHNYFVNRDIKNGVASTGFIQLRVNSDKVLPQYLYYYLTTDKKVQEYQAIAETSQSTFPSFNKEVIETMDFPDISLEGQYYIVDTVC